MWLRYLLAGVETAGLVAAADVLVAGSGISEVVAADALHAQHDAAHYIAGATGDGGRGADHSLFVKGNMPGLQRAIWDAIARDCPRDPDHAADDRGHGRHVRRSLWAVPAPDGLRFPHAAQVIRIRRDGYDP
jgi:hypothetical protein